MPQLSDKLRTARQQGNHAEFCRLAALRDAEPEQKPAAQPAETPADCEVHDLCRRALAAWQWGGNNEARRLVRGARRVSRRVTLSPATEGVLRRALAVVGLRMPKLKRPKRAYCPHCGCRACKRFSLKK